jgi:putative copper export protein
VRGFWLFIHIIGFTAWIGGGLATMLGGITAKHFPADQRLAVYRAISVVTRNLVGPGAVLVVLSGFILSVPFFKNATVPSWLMAMQGLGLLGAIVAIAIVTPTAARLGRLEADARGELPESFTGLRRRQVVFATLGGVLALLALLAGTVFRNG